jgi:hypothetical protein
MAWPDIASPRIQIITTPLSHPEHGAVKLAISVLHHHQPTDIAFTVPFKKGADLSRGNIMGKLDGAEGTGFLYAAVAASHAGLVRSRCPHHGGFPSPFVSVPLINASVIRYASSSVYRRGGWFMT